MFLLNELKDADVNFFLICLGIIVVIIAIWFLLPVFNHRQYKDQRDSLRKREAAFRSNLQSIKQQNEKTTTDAESVVISNANKENNEEEASKTE